MLGSSDQISNWPLRRRLVQINSKYLCPSKVLHNSGLGRLFFSRRRRWRRRLRRWRRQWYDDDDDEVPDEEAGKEVILLIWRFVSVFFQKRRKNPHVQSLSIQLVFSNLGFEFRVNYTVFLLHSVYIYISLHIRICICVGVWEISNMYISLQTHLTLDCCRFECTDGSVN